MGINEKRDIRQAFAWWLWNHIDMRGNMLDWCMEQVGGDSTADLDHKMAKHNPFNA